MSENGIVRLRSKYSIAETIDKLKSVLEERKIKLFTIIDHSAEAAKAGLSMPSTKLLIFGNPQAGTPLMLASPGIAIDLPLKALVSEDPEGNVWLSYNDPVYLRERHNLPAELVKNIAGIKALAEAAVK